MQVAGHITTLTPVVKVLLAGGLAGAISRTVVAPFERLKIIFQTQGHPPVYTGCSFYHLQLIAITGVWSGLVGMYKKEGLLGYFKGNGVNCVRVIPAAAIQFYTYDACKRVSTLFHDSISLLLGIYPKIFGTVRSA